MNSFDLRGYLSNNLLLNEAIDPKAEQIIKAVMKKYGRSRTEAVEDLTDMGVLTGYGDFQFTPKTRFKGSSDEYTETLEDKIASYYRNNDIEAVQDTADIPDIQADLELGTGDGGSVTTFSDDETEEEQPEEKPQEEPADTVDQEPLQGPEGDVEYDEQDFIDAYQDFLGDVEEIEVEKETVEQLQDLLKEQDPTLSDADAKAIANDMLEDFGEEDLKGILYAMTNTQEVEELPAEEQAEELEQAQDTIQELQPELEQASNDLDSLKSDLDSLTGNDELSGAMGSALDSLSGGTGTGQGVDTDGPGGGGDGDIGFNLEGFDKLIMLLIIALFANLLNSKSRRGINRERNRRNLKESKIEMIVQEKLDEQRLTEGVMSSLEKKYKDLIKKYKGRSAEAVAKSIISFVEDFKQTKSLPSAAKKFFTILSTNLIK